MARRSFSDLPREIRNEVYAHCTWTGATFNVPDLPASYAYSAIFRTNAVIAGEFLDFVFRDSTFLLDVRVNGHFKRHLHDDKAVQPELLALRDWATFLKGLGDRAKFVRNVEIKTDIFSANIEVVVQRGRVEVIDCTLRFDDESMQMIQYDCHNWMGHPHTRSQIHTECLDQATRRALMHALTMLCSRMQSRQDGPSTVEAIRHVSKYVLRAAVWVWDRLLDGAQAKFDPGSADEETTEIMLRSEGGFLLDFAETVRPRPCWGYESFLQRFGEVSSEGRE